MPKNTNERRDSLEIIVDILKAAQTPRRINKLQVKANMSNHASFKSYLDFLARSNLIEIDNGTYNTSSEGRKFLQKYEALRPTIGPEILRSYGI